MPQQTVLRVRRALIAIVVSLGAAVGVGAQTPEPPMTTLRVQTQLVVLDATVLDKAGRVVGKPLGRDEFQIEESGKPQTIYTFESQTEHVAERASDGSRTPLLIFVLDELNYAYQPFRDGPWNTTEQMNEETFERKGLVHYLKSQPEKLRERTEVLVLTHHGFQVLVPTTQMRDVAAARVEAHNPGFGSPMRDHLEETGGPNGGARDFTLSRASLQAIWSLALQQRSVPGRKVVAWLGVGAPDQTALGVVSDLLIEARITLDLMGPGLGDAAEGALTPEQARVSYGTKSDFGFASYITATGGRWSNGNDIEGEIQTTESYAASYYTLSYRPTNHLRNGAFRRIRVSVKGHPEWTVLTKAGYFGTQFDGDRNAEPQMHADFNVAMFEAMPFEGIGAALLKVERIRGTDRARFTFGLEAQDLEWHRVAEKDEFQATVTVAGAALDSVFQKGVLSSQATWRLAVRGAVAMPTVQTTVAVTIRVPAKTQRLRFVMRDAGSGRIGTVDLKPAALAAAPEIDAPKGSGAKAEL